MNREAWLTGVVRGLRPYFRSAGFVVPASTLVSVGWPSDGGERKNNRNVAQCWVPEVPADGPPQIFISPTVSDPAAVAALVAHEMIHAAGVPGLHGKDFQAAMKALGFVGPPTEARPGKDLRALIATIVERLGPYEHAAIKL